MVEADVLVWKSGVGGGGWWSGHDEVNDVSKVWGDELDGGGGSGGSHGVEVIHGLDK